VIYYAIQLLLHTIQEQKDTIIRPPLPSGSYPYPWPTPFPLDSSSLLYASLALTSTSLSLSVLFSSSRGGGGGVTWRISHYLSWVVSIGKQVGRGEEVLTWRLGPLSAMASQLGTTQTQNEYQRLKYK
jgi:hypothetical protein